MFFLTAGESHGEALAGIINGYPSGVKIDPDFINSELLRRQMGFGRSQRMSIEKDEIKIISGIRKEITIGAPIAFLIENLDWANQKERLEAEEDILNPRPGHADLPGIMKYHLNSLRDVLERSSARETAVRVAIGAFAKIILRKLGIYIISYVEQIGNIKINEDKYRLMFAKNFNPDKNKNDLDFATKIENSFTRCPDHKLTEEMVKLIKDTSQKGDSLGGGFRVFASGLVPGLGSYVHWDQRIDARIAAAVMSIPSVKSVSFGKGNEAAEIKGSDYHDEIFFHKNNGFYRKTNNAGGVEGGMTNGEALDLKAIAKPIPTITKGLKTVNLKTKEETVNFKERADTCAVPSAAIVAESMVAIEIVNAIQDKFGKDNFFEISQNYHNYLKYLKIFRTL